MKIKEIWFDAEHIFGRDEEGHEYSQSLLWYPKLRTATDEERAAYTFGFDGIHWRGLDEDISFESFAYDDTEPTPLQRFLLTHKEINVAENENPAPFMAVQTQALKEFREFKNMVAASDRPELTLDEINEEIRLAREERKARLLQSKSEYKQE